MIPKICTWARGPVAVMAHEADAALVRVFIRCVFARVVT
jgi:hypothetical protein